MLVFIADAAFLVWTIIILCTILDLFESLIYNIFVIKGYRRKV